MDGRPPVWHYEPPVNEEAPNEPEQKPEEQTKPSHATVSSQPEPNLSPIAEIAKEIAHAKQLLTFEGTLEQIRAERQEASSRLSDAWHLWEMKSNELENQQARVLSITAAVREMEAQDDLPDSYEGYVLQKRSEELAYSQVEKVAFLRRQSVRRWEEAEAYLRRRWSELKRAEMVSA